MFPKYGMHDYISDHNLFYFFTIDCPCFPTFSVIILPSLYPREAILFLSVIHFLSAVCSFPPAQVLTELIQPPGPHCSSPSRIPPASGAIRGFLADRQKGGPL
jgi:hypothetical protein